MKNRLALLSVLLVGSLTLLAAEPPTKPVENAAFAKLKVLVGSWQGTYEEGNEKHATNARFKLVSDHSALSAWLNEDSDHEMVTMIHPDGADLVATHYCSAHNQPRMFLVPGNDPNRLTFKFRDGTNIAPGDGHMQQVTFILDGPDHHIQEWTYLENGKENAPARFDFRRKP